MSKGPTAHQPRPEDAIHPPSPPAPPSPPSPPRHRPAHASPSDALASAVGLAKVWAHDEDIGERRVYVVLPRGAHPNVESFLGLHQNLFPIRRLKW